MLHCTYGKINKPPSKGAGEINKPPSKGADRRLENLSFVLDNTVVDRPVTELTALSLSHALARMQTTDHSHSSYSRSRENADRPTIHTARTRNPPVFLSHYSSKADRSFTELTQPILRMQARQSVRTELTHSLTTSIPLSFSLTHSLTQSLFLSLEM